VAREVTQALAARITALFRRELIAACVEATGIPFVKPESATPQRRIRGEFNAYPRAISASKAEAARDEAARETLAAYVARGGKVEVCAPANCLPMTMSRLVDMFAAIGDDEPKRERSGGPRRPCKGERDERPASTKKHSRNKEM
jgi:hypothetical protein